MSNIYISVPDMNTVYSWCVCVLLLTIQVGSEGRGSDEGVRSQDEPLQWLASGQDVGGIVREADTDDLKFVKVDEIPKRAVWYLTRKCPDLRVPSLVLDELARGVIVAV
jgi:hypothetical protein